MRSYEYSRDFHQSNREQKWGWFLYWHGVGLTELKAGHEMSRDRTWGWTVQKWQSSLGFDLVIRRDVAH